MNWIVENKEWLFSGLGISTITIGYYLFKSKSSIDHSSIIDDKLATNINKNNISININAEKPTHKDENVAVQNDMRSIKNIISILFIDDEKFNIVNTLKSSGWTNVSYRQDILNLQDPVILNAHIIFVDINGVGVKLFPKEHGRGLASALKDKYPRKKIILYSAETHGDRFDSILRKMDYCLPKNAEPIQFVNLVEQFASEIIL